MYALKCYFFIESSLNAVLPLKKIVNKIKNKKIKTEECKLMDIRTYRIIPVFKYLQIIIIIRGIMPIKTKCPLRFLSQVDFECSFQRQKVAESYFYIWYNHTGVIRSFIASNHQPLNSNLSSLAVAEPETDAFLQRCIITNHTWFCWPYECNDQSEAFRWVTAVLDLKIKHVFFCTWLWGRAVLWCLEFYIINKIKIKTLPHWWLKKV